MTRALATCPICSYRSCLQGVISRGALLGGAPEQRVMVGAYGGLSGSGRALVLPKLIYM